MRKVENKDNPYVTLQDNVHVPGTDVLLEKGDKVRFSEMVEWAAKILPGEEYMFSTEDGTIHIRKNPDGSYYGWTNKFDMSFPSDQDLNDAIEANSWTFIGVE